jgi:hypothetical protein
MFVTDIFLEVQSTSAVGLLGLVDVKWTRKAGKLTIWDTSIAVLLFRLRVMSPYVTLEENYVTKNIIVARGLTSSVQTFM